MQVNLLLPFLGLGSLFIVSSKERHLVLQWESLHCTGNDRYMRNINCRMNPPDNRTITSEVTLVKAISHSNFKGRIYLYKGTTENKQPLVEFDINTCKFLSSTLQSIFLQIVRAIFEKYSNIPTKCPIEKDVIYYVRNFTIDANFIPNFVPESKFYCLINFYIPGKGAIFTAETRGHLVDIGNL